ncbi:MAG: TlpA family protein disulfide reductase [Bacteroidaceae bacterium]|nr:TlpA family protein disulfide reductase [Bacteroidaceae bacterium]MBR3895655.1 TlpA family protein disulfide reductase [Bacteroidaceae bacterium]
MRQSIQFFTLAILLLFANGQALAFKKEFKATQWLYSNVGNVTITHVLLTDTATVVTFHKHDTTNGIRFAQATCLVDDNGKEYRIKGSEGIPRGEFFQFFPKTTNETNDFKLIFEPMPKKARFFDLIEGRKEDDFRILGIHDAKKPIPIPTFVDTVSIPQDFIHTDTVCLRGRIEGYSRNLGFTTLPIHLSNVLTNERMPKAIEIQEDGTFETKFVSCYPFNETLTINMPQGRIFAAFYTIPGCTTVVNIHKDWTVDYTGSDEEILRYERLMKNDVTNLCSYDYFSYDKDKDSLSFVQMQEKLMSLAKDNECLVNYIAWRNGFTPWEHHLAHVWNKLEHARWIFDYILDARSRQDSIIANPNNWAFYKQLPYNDASSLTYYYIDLIMNRYEFAPVLRKTNRIIRQSEMNTYMLKEDSMRMTNDKLITGKENASLWGMMTILRSMEYDLKFLRSNKEAQTFLVETRRKTVSHPALQAQIDRLYAKELEQQTATYSLPECEATRILRRMTDKYKGKYLLIDFWGMGCGPCRHAIERSKELRKAFRDHPEVDFLFIAAPESTEEAYNKYVKENLDGEDCQLITRDEYNKLMELFQFSGIPHYETLDKQGNVVREGLEYATYDQELFGALISILKKKLE